MRLEEILRDGFDKLELPLDETALGRFRRYAELLTEKNAVMNLTAIEGEEDTARLHFLDCAALLRLGELRGLPRPGAEDRLPGAGADAARQSG